MAILHHFEDFDYFVIQGKVAGSVEKFLDIACPHATLKVGC